MYKKIYSILIILFTSAYLIFSFIFYNIDLGKVIGNIKVIQYVHKINLVKLFELNKNPKISNNEAIYSSDVAVKNSYNNTNSILRKETEKSVFNSNETNNKQLISNLEKEKILSLAKGLVPYDEAKIELYLEKGSLLDVKSAINLLRERLSDKEFESIKSISIKYCKN